MGSHLEQQNGDSLAQIQIKDLNVHRPRNVCYFQLPEVNESQNIESIYHLLAQNDGVIILNSNNQAQYLLKREDIFNYLSERKGRITHA